MRFVVLDGRRPIATHDYCSAYTQGGAHLVSDARGQRFVLRTHSEGHGTRATNSYLTVYRLGNGSLHELRRLLIEVPIGFAANRVLDYDVSTPPPGGLVIRGEWNVDGKLREGERRPPNESVTVRIDPEAEIAH